ncbi:unnamed protein product [Heterotrigona itama]|uniref:Uncharacterized protein n=1 Tax=Heterotrigona itama TaxID=395501 RepID=A0A6V7GWV7_9HYME|nr:unnamed protein product [Heterotrigona itama]
MLPTTSMEATTEEMTETTTPIAPIEHRILPEVTSSVIKYVTETETYLEEECEEEEKEETKKLVWYEYEESTKLVTTTTIPLLWYKIPTISIATTGTPLITTSTTEITTVTTESTTVVKVTAIKLPTTESTVVTTETISPVTEITTSNITESTIAVEVEITSSIIEIINVTTETPFTIIETPVTTVTMPTITTETTETTISIEVQFTSPVVEVTNITTKTPLTTSAISEVTTVTIPTVTTETTETTTIVVVTSPIIEVINITTETPFFTIEISKITTPMVPTITTELMKEITTTIVYEYVEETTANMTTTEKTTEPTSVTTESSILLETTEITTPIVVHYEVNVTTPYVTGTTETVTTEFTVEITETPVVTTERIITTEEEMYETVTMHEKDYDEEEEEEKEEKKETVSPIWYEHTEENVTSTTPEMETPTKEIIRIEITIVKEELNITTPFVTVPEIISTIAIPFITEEIITTLERPTTFGTTLMYTLPPTLEFTMEHLPLDYLGENVTKSEEVTKPTTATVETPEISDITREKVTELPVSFDVTRTTNQEEKKQRQEEKKEELIEELKKLEKTEEEILIREKELERREEDWQIEKGKLIRSLYVKQQEMKVAQQQTTFASEPDTVTEESPALSKTTLSTEATTSRIGPMKPKTTVTPEMTTKDELEEEVKLLEKKYLEKEKWLKEQEKQLEEREKKFQKEKDEFETMIKELEEKLESGEEITLPTYGRSTLTTPCFSQLPPTERTTIEIRESTAMEPKTETSVRKLVTLSHEEEKEQKEEREEERKRKGTTRICVNVLKAKPLGKQAEDLVTKRVCLPFVPGQVDAKEQITKISGLYLRQHEWTEGPRFTKDRGESQTEFEDERSERKRSLTEQNRFKRNIPAKQHVHPQLRIDRITSRNDSIFMITGTSTTTEKSSNWEDNSNRYKARSMLQIIENKNEYEDEDEAKKNVKGYEKSCESRDYEDQIERNPRQGEDISLWTTKSANDEVGEEDIESETQSDRDDSVDDTVNDKETESIPEERSYSEDDDLEKEMKSEKTEEIPSEEMHKDNEVTKEKKTRQTPGPEWPTEALTAYQIGGTRTWMLEYPEVAESVEDEQDLKSVGKRPLEATTCYYVILRDEQENSLESPEGNYNQGNSFGSS